MLEGKHLYYHFDVTMCDSYASFSPRFHKQGEITKQISIG